MLSTIARRAFPPARSAAISTAPLRTLNLAICGGGTVGGGVCEILREHRTRFARVGVAFRVTHLLVREAGKERDFVVPEGCRLTDSLSEVLAADDVDCVVELMGGADGDALELVEASLARGTHVVTANKALLAAHLDRLEALLSSTPGTELGYEAAVCGGIPIVHALQRDYACDRVERLAGILNGTTNFILSRMEGEGLAYADALAEAQRLGFAEADPTADVEGHDARSKLVL